MAERPTVPCALLAAAVAAAALFVPRFASAFNVGNVLTQTVPILLTAAGQTVVLITGGIDLSVGQVVTLTTIVASSLMQPGVGSVAAAVAACLLAGAAVGAVNGLGIARFGLPPFLMTLATMFFLEGVNLYLRPVPGGFVPDAFRLLATARWGLVPVAAVVTVLLLALLAVHVRRSRFGLHLYAVGGGERRAVLAGVAPGGVKVRAYVVSAGLATLAGLFLVARTGTGDALVGSTYAFDSITAAVLGGASLFGGRGTLWGALASALLLGVLSNVLNLLRVVAYWQWIVKGLLLIVAVAARSLGEVRADARRQAVVPAD